MAYKYEKENIIKVRHFNIMTGSSDISKPTEELQEVYQKAKAWNNYLLSVEEDAKNEFGDNEALIKHAVELNKKIFMGDE